jgi:hypothetical protein
LIDVFSGRKNIAFDAERVDHAAVRDDDDVPIGMIRQDGIDGADDPSPEVTLALATGRMAPDRLLVADPVNQVRVARYDLFER